MQMPDIPAPTMATVGVLDGLPFCDLVAMSGPYTA